MTAASTKIQDHTEIYVEGKTTVKVETTTSSTEYNYLYLLKSIVFHVIVLLTLTFLYVFLKKRKFVLFILIEWIIIIIILLRAWINTKVGTKVTRETAEDDEEGEPQVRTRDIDLEFEPEEEPAKNETKVSAQSNETAVNSSENASATTVKKTSHSLRDFEKSLAASSKSASVSSVSASATSVSASSVSASAVSATSVSASSTSVSQSTTSVSQTTVQSRTTVVSSQVSQQSVSSSSVSASSLSVAHSNASSLQVGSEQVSAAMVQSEKEAVSYSASGSAQGGDGESATVVQETIVYTKLNPDGTVSQSGSTTVSVSDKADQDDLSAAMLASLKKEALAMQGTKVAVASNEASAVAIKEREAAGAVSASAAELHHEDENLSVHASASKVEAGFQENKLDAAAMHAESHEASVAVDPDTNRITTTQRSTTVTAASTHAEQHTVKVTAEALQMAVIERQNKKSEVKFQPQEEETQITLEKKEIREFTPPSSFYGQDYTNAIVFDCGSGMMKVGFGGGETPDLIFPTYVGRPKYSNRMGMMSVPGTKDIYVGDEATAKSGVLLLKYPIEGGQVKDWDDMDKIINYALYHELKCDPTDSAFIFTEPPLNPIQHREKMMEIMFDNYHAPAYYVGLQGVFQLYANGRSNGIVCEIGDGFTQVVPVWEGQAIKHACSRIEFGGRELTNYFITLLSARGFAITTTAEKEIARRVKESVCQVALDYNSVQPTLKHCRLPDGNSISVEKEVYTVPEVLFNPGINMYQQDPIQSQIRDAISRCDMDKRSEMIQTIVIGGGSTMFKGFEDRLLKEMQNLMPGVANDVNIIANPERKYGAWIGASIFSTTPSFPKMVISADEYAEYGPNIVHHKCAL